MNNVLLMLGALLVGVLAALVAVPMVVDWNGYRGVFEEEASRLLGRDVRVGGAVNVRVLPVPYVRFEKLRIADTASTGGDPLFRAESVTMRLSIAPLLRGVLEAQTVELKKPQLRLAVDAEGRGNWRSLSLKPGSLPFVPADVTLPYVGIEGGTLLFVSASGKELADFQAVDGELSADGFEGPFKFKGTASWSGEPRDIRFATSKPEADGSTKVRASVRVPGNQNSYLFDGRVVDLKGRPRIDGELSAKLPLGLAKGAKPPADGDGNAFELKAKVDGDLNGGTLSEIALALERVGDPQLITGEAKATWGDALRFDMALASRSLNLDQIGLNQIGADPQANDPLETARNALSVILSALPAEAQSDARLKAKRVTLAGEAVTGVTIAMSRRGAALDVRELRAVLPGNTRLDAAGTISREAKASAFTGPVTLRGANLARFLAWARHDGAARPVAGATAGHYDGPFMLDGQLEISDGAIALTRAAVEFADQPVTGEFRMTTEGRRRVVLVLQGQRIDASLIWPGGFNLEQLRTLLTGAGVAPPQGSAFSSGFYGFNPDTTDLKVELRAGEFIASSTANLRDVDAAFAVDRGTLTLPRLRFQTANGLSVDLEGHLAGLTVQPPKAVPAAAAASARRGVVRFVVGAPSAAAVGDLYTYLDWPVGNRLSEPKLASLGAMRLAGSATLGEHGLSSTDLAVDGTIDGGRVFGTAKFETGFNDWRRHGLDLTATIDTGNVGRWLGLAGFGSNGASLSSSLPASLARPGQVFLQATGQPASGLATLASITSDDLSVAYQGLVAWPAEGPLMADGAAGIAARDAADVLALADLSLGQGGSGVPMQGQVVVKITDGTVALNLRELTLGGSRLSGTASLSPPIGPATPSAGTAMPGPRVLTADLAVDRASIAALLAVVSDRRTDGAASQAKGPQRSVWPDQPLSFAGLDRLQGHIQLAVGRLALDQAAALTGVRGKISLAPGTITVEEFSGVSLGGSVRAQFTLQKSPAGAALTGQGQLTGANLASSLPIGLAASFDAQGQSASELVSALQGRGEAEIGAGQIKGVAPSGISVLVQTVLADKSQPPVGEPLAQVVRDALATTTLSLDNRTIPFTLAHGQARNSPVAFDTAQGRAGVETIVDLSQARFSTDWRIEAAAKPGVTGKPKAPLPAVILTLSGALANLDEAESRLVLSAFEQELGLRKLERDAEELERIRKLDEERRQKEDADRAAKIAAEAAAAALAEQASAAGAAAGAAGVPVPAGGTSVQPASPGGNASPAPVPAAASPPPTQTAEPVAPPSGGVRQPAPASASRRRAQEGLQQPLQNNF